MKMTTQVIAVLREVFEAVRKESGAKYEYGRPGEEEIIMFPDGMCVRWQSGAEQATLKVFSTDRSRNVGASSGEPIFEAVAHMAGIGARIDCGHPGKPTIAVRIAIVSEFGENLDLRGSGGAIVLRILKICGKLAELVEGKDFGIVFLEPGKDTCPPPKLPQPQTVAATEEGSE